MQWNELANHILCLVGLRKKAKQLPGIAIRNQDAFVQSLVDTGRIAVEKAEELPAGVTVYPHGSVPEDTTIINTGPIVFNTNPANPDEIYKTIKKHMARDLRKSSRPDDKL